MQSIQILEYLLEIKRQRETERGRETKSLKGRHSQHKTSIRNLALGVMDINPHVQREKEI